MDEGPATPPTPEKLRAGDVLVPSPVSLMLEYIERGRGSEGSTKSFKDQGEVTPRTPDPEEMSLPDVLSPSPLQVKSEDSGGFGSEEWRKFLELDLDLGSGSRFEVNLKLRGSEESKKSSEVVKKGSKKSFEEEGEDLVSESDLDLGEGSIEDSDFPDPHYAIDCEEDEEGLEDNVNSFPPHLKEIVQLPYDQVPAEYRGWRRAYKPYRTVEEQALYRHVLIKTDGFEVPHFPDRSPNFGEMCAFSYKRVHGSLKQELEGYCRQAINKYNEEKGTHYKLKYLIKMCGNIDEYNITFALTDPNYKPYVGRVHADFPVAKPVPILFPMKVTKGEYRAPKWKDAKDQEYKCNVNEEYREKLPELEKMWKQELRLE